MATKSISELNTAPDVLTTDLFETAVADQSSASGYKSYKQNLGNLSDAFAKDFDYNTLQTTSKKLVGSINEVALREKAMTATMLAGATTITFHDVSITASSQLFLSALDVYIAPTSVDTSVANEVTYTFEEQEDDIVFKLLIVNI